MVLLDDLEVKFFYVKLPVYNVFDVYVVFCQWPWPVFYFMLAGLFGFSEMEFF